MNRTGRSSRLQKALAIIVSVLLAAGAAAADKAKDRSLWDKARDGTAHAVKATGDAIQRGAKKTEQFLTRKDVPQKVKTAADKTGAAIDKTGTAIDRTAKKTGAAIDKTASKTVAKTEAVVGKTTAAKASPSKNKAAETDGFGEPVAASN